MNFFTHLTCPTGGRWRALTKTLLVMKLILLFIGILTFQVTATVRAQKLSLTFKNVPLEFVINEIKKQSDYLFWYNDNVLQKAGNVTLSVSNTDLKTVLDLCLAGQPLSYEIVRNTVIIREKTPSAFDRLKQIFTPPITVTGKVTDEKGTTIPSVNIRLKGTNKVVVTDKDGRFSIEVPDEKAVLQFTFIGYLTLEEPVKNRTNINITLKEDAQNLKQLDVVSTGYQNIPKERATGSFVILDSTLINRKVSTNILDRLDGVTSGIIFNNNNNKQFNQSNVQIRGRATLFANADPLIVVDNFPYDGDINNINPNDVLSISILKDAAAASAWGSRSGNGVIIITTKKGQLNSPTRVEFNANVNIGDKPDLYYTPRLTSEQFIEVEQFLFNKGAYWMINDGFSPLSPAVEIFNQTSKGLLSSTDSLALINRLKTYDSREQLLEYYYRPSIRQQYQTSISGGSANQKYFLSAGYDKNLNNAVNDADDRTTLNASNTFYFLNNKLELVSNILYTSRKSSSGINLSNQPWPYTQIADENGNPLTVTSDLRPSFINNVDKSKFLNWQYSPLDELNKDYSTTNSDQTDYRISLNLNYTILPGLKASALYTYQRGLIENNRLNELESYYTRNMINSFTQINSTTGAASYPIPRGDILYNNTTNAISKNGRVQLNYNNVWKKHALNILAGSEIKDFNSFQSTYALYGYNSGTATNQNASVNYTVQYPYSYGYNSSRIPTNTEQLGTTDRYLSFYTNASYLYEDKYILSLSARRDESNLFGVETNQKGVPLWSAGLSWILSKEPFYNATWLPILKLRATFGYTGNVDKSVSAYLTAVAQNTIQVYNEPVSRIVNPPNPSLRWEKVRNLNLGIDFATKSNRISGSLDYWRKRGTDLIGNSPIAPQTGISMFRGNSANTLGRGVDLELTSQNLNGRLQWSTTFLYNYYKDKVMDYKVSNGTNLNVVSANYNNPLAGYPYYAIFSFRYRGLDNSGNPVGYLNGDESTDYAAILNSNDRSELVFHGSASPTSFGSLRNDFNYKRINLSFNVTYKFGYYFRRNSLISSSVYSSTGPSNSVIDYEKRWQRPGDELRTQVPSLIYPVNFNRDNLYRYSASLIEKGSHIRLQDIRIGYTLSKQDKIPFHTLNIFAYSNNIGLLWKANKQNIDPDFPSGIPTARTIAFGLKGVF